MHRSAAERLRDAARPVDIHAACPVETDELACPSSFVDGYTAAYRAAFRLQGDADRAAHIARKAMAAADASIRSRSDQERTVRVCRTAAMSALREPKGVPPAEGDERARLRAALRALPAQPRAAFLLVRLAGLPASDVGDVLGGAPDWCTSRLQAADRSICEVFDGTGNGPRLAPPSVSGQSDGPSRGRRAMLLAARAEH